MKPVLQAVGAVFLSAALVYMGSGLLGVLLPLRGLAEGFSTVTLGLLGTMYALGFLFGCLYAPRIIRRVGHIRAFAVFAAIAANNVLFYPLLLNEFIWLGIRMLNAAALAGMFMVCESWLNERATPKIRGKVFSFYMVIHFVAVIGGQVLVATGRPEGIYLFLIATILISTALIPVGLTRVSAPKPLQSVKVNLRKLYGISPVGVGGSFLVGVAAGAFGTLAAVFVIEKGFTAADAGLFLSAAIVGAAVMQIPSGALSDRVDRRKVIVGLGVLAAIMGLWMTVAGGTDGTVSEAARDRWLLKSMLFGAVSYPLYSLCVAHLNDHVEEGGFVEASSGLLIVWSIGAALGPLLASLVMSAIGPRGLFAVTMTAHAALAAFALSRIMRRAAPDEDDKGEFVPHGVLRTSPGKMGLDPRVEEEEIA